MAKLRGFGPVVMGVCLMWSMLSGLSSTFGQTAAGLADAQHGATILSDRFDVDQQVGQPPAGWTVSAPEGTTVLVQGKEASPDTPPQCVHMTDTSPTARPQMYRKFSSPAAAGVATVRIRVPKHEAGPVSIQLRTADSKLLVAVMMLDSARMGYATSGPNVKTEVIWPSNQWVTVRIDWDAAGYFNAYLGQEPIVTGQAMALPQPPAQLLLCAGYGQGQQAEGYFDNVDVATPALAEPTNAAVDRLEHGVWLSHGYCIKPNYAMNTAQVVTRLIQQCGVKHIYLNIGLVNGEGVLPYTAADYAGMNQLLAGVADAEAATGTKVKLLAWINAQTERTNLSQDQVRKNIVLECLRFVSTQIPGSYVNGQTRLFDGIHFDLEPSGLESGCFPHVLELMRNMRSQLNADGAGLSDKSISIAAHTFGERGKWQWPAQYFYDMAGVADEIAIMMYDGGAADGPAYQKWLIEQTPKILSAVSGAYWANDSTPVPARSARVVIGMGAYTFKRNHNHCPEAESVINGSIAFRKVLTQLSLNHPNLLPLLGGAAVFAQSDDAGKDGYACTATDWYDFRRFLLGKSSVH
jgi:hypothetical protein